jgi:predicted DCC family thiol-disulfide oxidoreductase YuxK
MALRQRIDRISDTSFLVIYDGDCGLCQATIRWIRSFIEIKADFHSYHALSDSELQHLGITRRACDSAIQVFDSRSKNHVEGAEGLHLLLKHSPLASLIRALETIAIVRFLEDALYRGVSQNRAWLSSKLGLASCKIGTNHFRRSLD